MTDSPWRPPPGVVDPAQVRAGQLLTYARTSYAHDLLEPLLVVPDWRTP